MSEKFPDKSVSDLYTFEFLYRCMAYGYNTFCKIAVICIQFFLNRKLIICFFFCKDLIANQMLYDQDEETFIVRVTIYDLKWTREDEWTENQLEDDEMKRV